MIDVEWNRFLCRNSSNVGVTARSHSVPVPSHILLICAKYLDKPTQQPPTRQERTIPSRNGFRHMKAKGSPMSGSEATSDGNTKEETGI
jgi:hypothetical protein